MSKPRFQIIILIDTENHANTIKNSIANRLSGKDIFEEHSFRVENLSAIQVDNQSGIIGEWRFNNSIDLDDVKDWIRDQVENHPIVKTWVLAAKVSWHNCKHDEKHITNCRNENYFEFIK